MSGPPDGTIVFVSHTEMHPMVEPIAIALRKAAGIDCVMWTLGGRDHTSARGLRGFADIVNLMDGFDRFDAVHDERRAENVAVLRELEQSLDSVFVNRDLAMDRNIVGFTDAEVDYLSIRQRWSSAQLVALGAHLLRRAREELARRRVVATMGETNIFPYRLLERLVVGSAKIPFLQFCYLPYAEGRVYLETTRDFDWPECRDMYELFLAHGVPAAWQELAEPKLNEIRKHYSGMSYGWAERRPARTYADRLKVQRIRQTLSDWRSSSIPDNRSSPRSAPPEVYTPRARVGRLVRGERDRRLYERLSSRELPTDNFVSYFLHTQPEHNVDALAFEYMDQVALLRNIVACLPAGMRLVVKEHFTDGGRRSKLFYQELVSIPNTVLVHHGVDTSDVIRRSSVIVTLTGTVALEAICLGIPAIVLGHIYYRHFRGAYPAEDLNHLADLLSGRSPLTPATDEEAIAALAARFAASMPGDYPGPPDDEVNADRLASAIIMQLGHQNGFTRDEANIS